MVQRYNTSVAGGTELMQYYIGGNLSDEEGAIQTSANTTGGFRGNFTFRPRPEPGNGAQLLVSARQSAVGP